MNKYINSKQTKHKQLNKPNQNQNTQTQQNKTKQKEITKQNTQNQGPPLAYLANDTWIQIGQSEGSTIRALFGANDFLFIVNKKR